MARGFSERRDLGIMRDKAKSNLRVTGEYGRVSKGRGRVKWKTERGDRRSRPCDIRKNR